MKVAIVCPYAWDRVGGVQSHVRSLAPALRRRGHDVHIVAPASDLKAKFPEGEGVLRAGFAISVPANGSVAPLAFGPLSTASVRRALRSVEPDVIHVHEPLIPSLSLLATWVADGVPLVGTFHAARSKSAGYHTARSILDRAMQRLAVRTVVSEAARDLVARYFPGEYRMTPNGIPFERFAEALPLEIDAPRPRVLFFGRLERRKGLEVLIQAMARVRDLGATLVVAGSGPEERSCRALARNLEVDAVWLGRLDENDVPGIYAASDVYCAPAIGGESFGIVLAEAMASGVPVICSDLPGFRSVVGDAARVVGTGDAGEMSHAVTEVLTDEALAASLVEKGRRRAAAFDWETLVAEVERAYEDALATVPARASRAKRRRAGRSDLDVPS